VCLGLSLGAFCVSRARPNGRALCHLHPNLQNDGTGPRKREPRFRNAAFAFLHLRNVRLVGDQMVMCFVHSLRASQEVTLNRKAKIKAKRESSATNSCIISAGEIFADGAMIELVSGSSGLNKPELLLWNGRRMTAGPRVEHGGCIYQAPDLAPSLYRAMRLPSRSSGYGSARSLFAAITDLFQHHLDLPDRESSLLASFSISTWLADRLPTAPCLAISGPDQELGMDVLRLLGCVCRHSLMLAEITPGGFRSLPMELGLTLLLNQQEVRPNLQRLFRASSYPGLHLPGNGGRLVDLYGPKAIFCGNDAALDTLRDGVIHISVTPSQLQSTVLSEPVQNEIANSFQSRLLMYRLKNCGKLHESQVDVSTFTFATRPLARTLALCFPEDSGLARDTVQLLRPQDDEVRGQRSRDVNCTIVEILWAITHEGKQREVQVDELAKDVNTLLKSRGETLIYSPEQIGWKLKSLNIPRHSSSAGRQVLLERDTRHYVHRLARAYDLACTQSKEAGCHDCNQAKAAISK